MTLSQTILSFRVNSQPFLIKIGGIKPPKDLETFPPKRFQEKSLGNSIITKRRPRAKMKRQCGPFRYHKRATVTDRRVGSSRTVPQTSLEALVRVQLVVWGPNPAHFRWEHCRVYWRKASPRTFLLAPLRTTPSLGTKQGDQVGPIEKKFN